MVELGFSRAEDIFFQNQNNDGEKNNKYCECYPTFISFRSERKERGGGMGDSSGLILLFLFCFKVVLETKVTGSDFKEKTTSERWLEREREKERNKVQHSNKPMDMALSTLLQRITKQKETN